MKAMSKKICLFLSLFYIFSSFALSRSLKQDLTISLKTKRIEDFNLSGLSLIFYINISNSSSSPYYLSGYNYRFVVNSKEYFRLQTSLEEGIKIKAKGDTLLSFPLKVTYSHLFQAVEGIEGEYKALGYLAGSMAFSDGQKEKGKLPFTFSGEFPIFRKTEIELLSFQVKDLTIGGADLSFEVNFKNSNPFELLINRISYKIFLGENLIDEGVISGDKNIESQGEKAFSLPLLLNFFEVGKDIYNILQQPSSFCRFSGEVEARTIWGKVKIPFDKNENVTISRTS